MASALLFNTGEKYVEDVAAWTNKGGTQVTVLFLDPWDLCKTTRVHRFAVLSDKGHYFAGEIGRFANDALNRAILGGKDEHSKSFCSFDFVVCYPPPEVEYLKVLELELDLPDSWPMLCDYCQDCGWDDRVRLLWGRYGGVVQG